MELWNPNENLSENTLADQPFVAGNISCQVTMKTASGQIKSSKIDLDVPNPLSGFSITGS